MENLVRYVPDRPGRLSYEMYVSQENVIQQIYQFISSALVIRQIKMDKSDIASTAVMSMKKICAEYPNCPVGDIGKAIEMAAFGEIKIEGQLNVISAENIYLWYKEFRISHSHHTTMPMLPLAKLLPPEPTIEEKVKLSVDGLKSWLSLEKKETDIMAQYWYESLIKKGLMPDPDPKEKTRIYREIVLDILFNKSNMTIVKGGMDMIRAANRYKEAMEIDENGTVTSWPYIQAINGNSVHQKAAIEAKSKLVCQWVENQDQNELIEKYEKIVFENLQQKENGV